MADKKQKILIVDDSEMNRDILAVMLGSDYEILEAENGLEAIEILQQGMTDIDPVSYTHLSWKKSSRRSWHFRK